MKLCFTAFLVVSNVLLTDAVLTFNTTTLTAEQEKNVVRVLEVTGDEESIRNPNSSMQLQSAIAAGIEEIAKTLITRQVPLMTTVVIKPFPFFLFQKSFEFFVSTGPDDTPYEIVDGSKLQDKAYDIKSAIEKIAKDSYPDLKISVSVFGQGLAAWAVLLIVIEVLLVVVAAGFLITHPRIWRGYFLQSKAAPHGSAQTRSEQLPQQH